MGKTKKEEILKLISDYCKKCEVKEFCCENECVLWNIENVITEEE